ncbi:GspH/FimT family pseudopilin [Ramlibacter humi]|nr:GspH/FimT family pseudopilin [Ramlibacter humi]
MPNLRRAILDRPLMGRRRSRATRGFTIIELMTVMAIIAVVATVGLPSFQRMIQGAAVSGAVNSFLSDMRYARSEAMRRGGRVVLCRSSNAEAASPTCDNSSAPAGWATGWVVFVDLDGNGVLDPADPILKIQPSASGLDLIDDGGASKVYRFTALGRLLPGAAAVQMSFGGAAIQPSLRRTVCVLPTGAARLQPNGMASCAV